MLKVLNRGLLAALVLALAFGGPAFAQMTVTGSIVGNVTDPSGQVVVGAKVTLSSPKTGESRNALTNETGTFNFIAVQPDSYSLKVEHGGFKTFQRNGVVVSANEHVAAGDIQLQIGAVSDTVTVE